MSACLSGSMFETVSQRLPRRPFAPALALVLAVVLAVASLAVGCRDDARDAVPERLPETIPDEALPPLPKLTAESVPGAIDTAGGPLPLTASAAPGSSWTQHLELQQVIRHGGPGVPRGESDLRQELTVGYTVGADGRLAARIEAAAVRLKPDLPGVVAAATESLRGLSWSWAQDARGRVTAVQVVEAGPAEGRPGLAAIRAALEQTSLELPEGPVAPGTSWTVERTVDLPLTATGSVPAQLTTNATFRGVTGRDGRRVAVLDLALRQQLRGTLAAEGAPAEIVGAAAGRGVVLHDLALGRIVAGEVVLGGRQELLVHAPDGRRLLVQEHTLRLVTTEGAAAQAQR